MLVQIKRVLWWWSLAYRMHRWAGRGRLLAALRAVPPMLVAMRRVFLE